MPFECMKAVCHVKRNRLYWLERALRLYERLTPTLKAFDFVTASGNRGLGRTELVLSQLEGSCGEREREPVIYYAAPIWMSEISETHRNIALKTVTEALLMPPKHNLHMGTSMPQVKRHLLESEPPGTS